jgi:hypothetical protein
LSARAAAENPPVSTTLTNVAMLVTRSMEYPPSFGNSAS